MHTNDFERACTHTGRDTRARAHTHTLAHKTHESSEQFGVLSGSV